MRCEEPGRVVREIRIMEPSPRALEDLTEAQVPPNLSPLDICHHEQIITPSSVCLSGTAPPSVLRFWFTFREPPR